MKNYLNEELGRMKFLFSYDKGKVISEQESNTTAPSLPKAEPTTELGNVPKSTWEEMQETANTKPNYYTGEGESINRETAKSKSMSNAKSNALKKLNKTESNLPTKEINGILSRKGDGTYVYRALYYITQV
jgi:hypothetical protein